jgi:hypothetical protein
MNKWGSPDNIKNDDQNKEICICAAVKNRDGIIIRGQRHADCYFVMRTNQIETNGRIEGFMTSKNRFVGRIEGRKLQDAAGIKSVARNGYITDDLYSEDLY